MHRSELFFRRGTVWQSVSEKAVMSKHSSRARTTLEVTIMFEPTRLAATHLADAYAQVVPLRSRLPRQPPDVTVEVDALAARRRRSS